MRGRKRGNACSGVFGTYLYYFFMDTDCRSFRRFLILLAKNLKTLLTCMKKIVLLSLSVFAAFSALSCPATPRLGAVRALRTAECRPGRVNPSKWSSWAIPSRITGFGADPDFFARNGFVDRGISGQTTVRDARAFPPRRHRPEPAGRGDPGGHQRHRAEQRRHQNSKTSSATSSRCAIWPASTGSSVVLCSVLPCDRFSWRPEMEPAGMRSRTTQYDAGTLRRGAEDPLCGLPSGAR